MTQRRQLKIQIFILCSALLTGGATAEPEASSQESAARNILKAAFINRYEVDLTTRIDLTIHGRLGQQRHRTLRAVTKVINDRDGQ